METKKWNIYQKLQKIRVELQNKKLVKSGQNKFAKYNYFELQDFLPTINQMMLDAKLSSYICFGTKYAKLTIINIEDPKEKIVFSSPMATAALKGCHDVQNLGAVQTYLRRYLYINAFEIVENDALDAGEGLSDNGKKTSTHPPKEPMETSSKPSNAPTISKEPPDPWDVCPQCKGNLLPGKAEYGGGWYCENNKKGCRYKLNADKTVKSKGYKSNAPAEVIGKYDNPPY